MVRWSFHPPTPPSPPPLVTSLSGLHASLPEAPTSRVSIEKTTQALSDFTGYLASQTYQAHGNYHITTAGTASFLTPEEEEIRREIRALKGLVLNRYVSSVVFWAIRAHNRVADGPSCLHGHPLSLYQVMSGLLDTPPNGSAPGIYRDIVRTARLSELSCPCPCESGVS